jgi:hypothetical protein
LLDYRCRTIARLATLALLVGLLAAVGAAPAHAARVKMISINDVSLVEGDAGTKSLAFTVSWKGSKGGAAPSAGYATGDATAVAGSDYTSKSGTVNLTNGGCRCGTITIAVSGDAVFEGTETFAINLSSPVNGTLGDTQGIGTIYDNEGPPSLVVTDASAAEGDGSMGFTVLLTSTSASAVTVDYATGSGTATAADDYTTASGSLTFSAGQTSKAVSVPVLQDALSEDLESFTLGLTNASGAGITAAQANGSITDDDAESTFSVNDVAVAEGASGTVAASFTVTLSAAAGRETLVDVATSDGSATADTDYAPSTNTLTFAAGETSKEVAIDVAGDTVYEGDEAFSVALSSPVNADITQATGVGTITDDDPVPSASVDDVAIAEGTTGTSIATFTVSLSNPSAFVASVDWSTADGSATTPADYQASAGTVSLSAGQTSGTFAVTVQGDSADEPNETYSVALASPWGATVADGTGVGTITDDDKTPTALTAKVRTTARALKVSGVLETAVPGMKVAITLQKKQGGRYMKVAMTTTKVVRLTDRDSDGLTDGTYAGSFKRPKRGAYRVLVKYAGSAENGVASKKVVFRL